MNAKPRMCCYCGVDPADTYCRWYCSFCYHRFQKLRLTFRRYGSAPMEIRNLHRTWNHWKSTPELDAMYLEPMERAA